jgi:uncharacterized protein (DUF427 family)
MATRSVVTRSIRRFLAPEPLPKRFLYVEPLRRRMRVRFGGIWIADNENVLLLFGPGRYPMAYFLETDVSPDTLQRNECTRGVDRGRAHSSSLTPAKGFVASYRAERRHVRADRGSPTDRSDRLRTEPLQPRASNR